MRTVTENKYREVSFDSKIICKAHTLDCIMKAVMGTQIESD